MSSDIKALIVLIISNIFLEFSGFWLIKRGKETSVSLYRNLGIVICLAAPLILIVGIIGLFFII
jgi:hypothetical protein